MSEEPRQKWDRWPTEFRERALERMKTCENVRALAKELGVARQLLYVWKQEAEGRRKPCKPVPTQDPRDRQIRNLEKRVGELERVIGRKTLELDFFAGALRRIEESRQKKGRAGETASTPKLAGGCNRKAN